MNVGDVKTIHDWLAKLIGLRLSASWRAADMRVFHFGTMNRRNGGSVGEFALHIQCSWRIDGRDAIVTGRSDLWEPIHRPDGFSYNDWDYDRDGNLQDKLIGELLERSNDLIVESVDVSANGSFSVGLSDQCQLLVFPEGSSGEDWRLFRPGFTEESDHLVISGGAIE